MAVSPETNEAFLREVDEELRRDQMLGFWRRWGRWLLAIVVIGLIVFAGWLYWQHRADQTAGVKAEQMSTALDALEQQQTAKATPVLEELAKGDNEGYRAVAKLALADIAVQKGDLKAAATGYGAVAADEDIAEPFRNLALIRQTAAEFDMIAPQQAIDRLKPLAEPGNPWFGSAGEMVAISYLRLGKRDEAGRLFAALARDNAVPPTLRSRAVQMAGLLGVDAVDQSNGMLNK